MGHAGRHCDHRRCVHDPVFRGGARDESRDHQDASPASLRSPEPRHANSGIQQLAALGADVAREAVDLISAGGATPFPERCSHAAAAILAGTTGPSRANTRTNTSRSGAAIEVDHAGDMEFPRRRPDLPDRIARALAWRRRLRGNPAGKGGTGRTEFRRSQRAAGDRAQFEFVLVCQGRDVVKASRDLLMRGARTMSSGLRLNGGDKIRRCST